MEGRTLRMRASWGSLLDSGAVWAKQGCNCSQEHEAVGLLETHLV